MTLDDAREYLSALHAQGRLYESSWRSTLRSVDDDDKPALVEWIRAQGWTPQPDPSSPFTFTVLPE